MKVLRLAALSSLLVGALFADSKLIKGFQSPESVYASKDFIFVSNIGKDPEVLAKDNDGFISKLNTKGNFVQKHFATNLNAPKGMIELNGLLYVLDIDRVVGFRLENGQKAFELEIKGSAFLNDVVALDKQNLLLSDTGTGNIYKLDTKNKSVELFTSLDLARFGGGNGLLLSKDKQKLIIACYHPDGKSGGVVLELDLKSKNLRVLDKSKNANDGLAYAKNGDLLLSDWGANLDGKIYRLDTKGNKTALKLPLMRGVADTSSARLEGKDRLLIPKMLENELLIIDLP